MPKYIFKCSTCGRETTKYTASSVKFLTCDDSCSSIMHRLMPKLRGLKNTETIDKFTDKKHIDDHAAILKERKADYYWEVTVPELVNSGTYTMETMLEQDWVYFNEKGELVTRTKPPQKS